MFRTSWPLCLHTTDPAESSVRVTVKVLSILMVCLILSQKGWENQRFPDLDAPETKVLRTVPAEQFSSHLQVR